MKKPLASSSPAPKGVTLIELTIVIAIVMLLLSVLLMSAEFYTKAADRSACIVNLSGLQKTARSYQNLNGLRVGDPFTVDMVTGENKAFTSPPVCPLRNGPYALSEERIQPAGTAMFVCSEFDINVGSVDKTESHTSVDLYNW